jgi:hypothetical protein
MMQSKILTPTRGCVLVTTPFTSFTLLQEAAEPQVAHALAVHAAADYARFFRLYSTAPA